MGQFQKAQIILLPSEQEVINTLTHQIVLSSSLFWTTEIEKKRYTKGSEWLFLNNCKNGMSITTPNKNYKKQHLYIVRHEDLKENDYFLWYSSQREEYEVLQYDFDRGYGIQTKNISGDGCLIVNHSGNCGKIISTTDTSLKIKHDCDCGATTYEGCSQCLEFLPQPSKKFIEDFIIEYNKDNKIIDIMIEYEVSRSKEIYFDGIADFKPKEIFEIKINFNNTINIKEFKQNWNLEEVSVLVKALEKIVEMNYQHAEDQYGDKTKAESWSCVKVAKEALQKSGF